MFVPGATVPRCDPKRDAQLLAELASLREYAPTRRRVFGRRSSAPPATLPPPPPPLQPPERAAPVSYTHLTLPTKRLV